MPFVRGHTFIFKTITALGSVEIATRYLVPILFLIFQAHFRRERSASLCLAYRFSAEDRVLGIWFR